ncbi:MAG: DUF2059 domain-containing protein [Pseudomonadota bacterium]|nr:DUF2059 domain-containing protein [Pseudomonadota bacterium]
MKSLACSFGLLLAAVSYPAPAQTASDTTTSQNEATATVRPATAAALARAVTPSDVVIPAELEEVRKAILSIPTLDEDAKQLEQEYPGLYAAVWTAVEPEMRRQIEVDRPGFWAKLEQLYLARLTEREAQGLLAFFQSATGQKLIRNMYGSIDASPLFAELAKSDKATIGAPQIQAVTDAAKAKAVGQMGPEDESSLVTLAAAMDLKKFQEIGAETQKISVDWANREDPEGEEKIAKIMETAMERYMDAHPPKD